jgi:hypothetical protein
VGSGQSEIEADRQATEGVTRPFESRVRKNTYRRVKAVVDASGVKVAGIESYISDKSKTPVGVEIVKRQYNEKKSTYFALAAFDKKQAKNNWKKERKSLDGFAKDRLKDVDSAKGRFMKLKSLYKVLGLWIQREVVLSRLEVVGYSKKAKTKYDVTSILRRIQEERAEIPVFVDVSGEHAGAVRDRISEALLGAGFILTDNQTEAGLLVTGSVDVKSLGFEDKKRELARATASLTVKDSETGLIVGKLHEDDRAGHVTFEEAAHRALKAISPVVTDRLIRLITLGDA